MNPVTLLVQLFMLASLAIIAATPFVLGIMVTRHLRTRRCRRGVIITSSFAIGLFAGGVLAWNLVPSSWSMPFWETAAASGNAEKYGHVIEHTAENILVGVTFAAVSCGILSALAAAVSIKVLARLKSA